MKIVLIHNARFPVRGYGGTERLVWWLAKGLHQRGIKVTLACAPNSQCPYAETVLFDDATNGQILGDVLHFFNTPPVIPDRPHLVTIGGNGKMGEKYSINTVFVSRNHAERHGASAFVYNGIDPDDYIYSDKKEKYLCFLAKATWKVKNVKGAIRIARKAGSELRVLGGHRWFLNHWRGIHWEGMVDGGRKAEFLSKGAGLLFPVLWHEPFGIAVVEALVSGTPVLGTPFGSLPELISKDVGKICSTEAEFLDAIPHLGEFRPADCREWALSRFHFHQMVQSYEEFYSRVATKQTLNERIPQVLLQNSELLSLP